MSPAFHAFAALVASHSVCYCFHGVHINNLQINRKLKKICTGLLLQRTLIQQTQYNFLATGIAYLPFSVSIAPYLCCPKAVCNKSTHN